jgi:hypothetical protein
VKAVMRMREYMYECGYRATSGSPLVQVLRRAGGHFNGENLLTNLDECVDSLPRISEGRCENERVYTVCPPAPPPGHVSCKSCVGLAVREIWGDSPNGF